VAESNVKLRVDAREAVNAINQTNNASKKLNATLKTTSTRTGTATANIQRFGISFRSVVGPMVALTGALTLANKSLNTFGKRQADLKVLASQLERIGSGGAEQLQQLKAAADELGDATLFSQDDFIESFNVLTSFRAIAVKSFTEVSEVAADIAQVMGTDVKSATVQLAKALEDPTRGLTALSRSGITFDPVQTKMIKNLVKSNKLLEAQALILKTVKGQYVETARAAGTGFAGAMDLVAENAGDAAEALGKGLEPAATAAANAIAAVLENVSKIPAPAGQLAIQIGLVTGGVIALTKAVKAFLATKLAGIIGTQIALFKAFGAQIYLTAAAQGALNLAVAAFPFAIAALAIGSLIKTLYDAKTAQERFNNAIADGSVESLKAAISIEEETISVERNKGAKMSLLGINSKLIESQQRLTKLRDALATAESKPKTPKPTPIPIPIPEPDPEDLEKEAKRLARIAAASADRVRSLGQQTLLAAALTDEERKQFERKIQIADIIKNTQGFSDDQLRAELEATFALHEQQDATIAINKANEDRLKLEEHQKKNAEDLAQKQKEIAQTIQNSVVGAIESAIDGSKSLAESFSGLLKQLAMMIIKQKVIGNFASLGGGGLLGLIPGLADGGPARAGRPHIVGERGPELFVPNSSGTVVPNHAMGGNASVTVNVDASGSSVEGDGDQAAQLGKAIGIAVQQELIKQKRPGGLLTR
tara:strand:- start:6463 stop:8586 length:2124 start_codon:yes stop_codon:yes gene_type:complete